MVEKRQEGEVVIPMIAFIEGGTTIPMGTVTRDYLRLEQGFLNRVRGMARWPPMPYERRDSRWDLRFRLENLCMNFVSIVLYYYLSHY